MGQFVRLPSFHQVPDLQSDRIVVKTCFTTRAKIFSLDDLSIRVATRINTLIVLEIFGRNDSAKNWADLIHSQSVKA